MLLAKQSHFLHYIQLYYVFLYSYYKLSIIDKDILTSSSCHPKIFVKEFSYSLMSCHQHSLRINLLVQR